MNKQVCSWRLCVALLVLPLGLLVAGCGSSHGTVSGKVSFRGQPLRGGTVSIIPQAGGALTGEIKQDGTYTIAKVPTGPAKVAVETASVRPSAMGGGQARGPAGYYAKMAKEAPSGTPSGADPTQFIPGGQKPSDPKKYVPIPEQFGDVEKSGVTLTVTGGKQPFDIDLK
jgi:hypothetical protein